MQRCKTVAKFRAPLVKHDFPTLTMLYIRLVFVFAVVSFIFIGSQRSKTKHNYQRLLLK